jgi:hypothetical protein
MLSCALLKGLKSCRGLVTLEIAARVYIGEDSARRVLHDLAHRRLIGAEPGPLYVYDPAWDESAQLLPRVADTYRRHLIRIGGAPRST